MRMQLLSERTEPKVRLVHPGATRVGPAAGNHFSCAKSFVIRTSKTPLPQPLYNPHFRDPLASADSKRLTGPDFLPQPFYNQHLQDPLGSAGNKGLITPVESALTKNPPATPLESALPKNRGVYVYPDPDPSSLERPSPCVAGDARLACPEFFEAFREQGPLPTAPSLHVP